MFSFYFTSAQEMSSSMKAQKDIVEIKKVLSVDTASCKYVESLLVYYYENGGDSEFGVNNQIIENIYNKLRQKLSKEDFDIVCEKWLRKNQKNK